MTHALRLIPILIALTSAGALAAAPKQAPDRLLLVKTFLALGAQPSFTPSQAAEALGARLGPAERPTEYRTDYPLAGTALFKSGEISTTKTWRVVAVEPAPALALTLQEVLTVLLDLPYAMETRTGHDGDGRPHVIGKDYLFLVKGGMLVVSVPVKAPGGYKSQLEKAYGEEWTAAAGKRTAAEPVSRLLLTNEPRPGLEKAPTLRAFRKQAQSPPPSR